MTKDDENATEPMTATDDLLIKLGIGLLIVAAVYWWVQSHDSKNATESNTGTKNWAGKEV